MNPLLWETFIALATVILAPLLTWLLGGRRRVKIDAFTAFTTAQASEIARQDNLITGLRDDVDDLAAKLQAKDAALTAEQSSHASTRAMLARTQDIVRRYFQRVRDAWATGSPMPSPDPGDLDWLAQPKHDEPPAPPVSTL